MKTILSGPGDPRQFDTIEGTRLAPPVNLQLVLSPDSLTLTINITPPVAASYDQTWIFRVFWIPGDGPISPYDLTTQPFDLIFSLSQPVVDVRGGSSLISTPVSAKLYQSGWMYAISYDSTGKQYLSSRTHYVAVPVPSATAAPGFNFTNPAISINPIGVTTSRLILFGWTNPAPLDTARYCQIYAYNYFNDGQYREGPVFPVRASAGQKQGFYPLSFTLSPPLAPQSMVLETDQIGAHNVTFYWVPLSAGYLPKLPVTSNANIVVGGGIS